MVHEIGSCRLDGYGLGFVEVVRRDHRTQALGDGAAASAGEQLEQLVLDPALGGSRAIGMEGICRAPQVFEDVDDIGTIVIVAPTLWAARLTRAI